MAARTIILLIILAALQGAPPSASATEPNVEDGRPHAAVIVSSDTATVDGGSRIEEDLLVLLVLTGLIGLASVALLGIAFILAWRRRDERLEPEAEAAAVLLRRTIRRARMRLPNDPIVDSLGIDPEGQGRHRRPRTERAGRGAGDRAMRGRRR